MGSFFRKLFAPWTAEACFDDSDDFYAFLLRRNKILNAVRVVFFLIAAVCLMLGFMERLLGFFLLFRFYGAGRNRLLVLIELITVLPLLLRSRL